MSKLASKVALIAGSDSGIGQAPAVQFAQQRTSAVTVCHTDQPSA